MKEVDPGLHVISLSGVSGYIFTPRSTPLDINIDAGGSHYIRVVSIYKGYVTAEFQGVDEQVANLEITSLHLPD